MRRWSDSEWSYCLHCFYRSETVEDSITLFKTKYPDRSDISIKTNFKKENIDIDQYIGSGLGKNKLTKRNFIQALTHVYKVLGEPFDKEQFKHISEIKYENLIGYFGSFENALKEANLLKKFNTFLDINKEIKSFSPEKELQKNWEKQKEGILKKAEDKKVAWIRDQANKLDIVNQVITEAVAKADPILVEVYRKPILQQEEKEKSVFTLWFEFSDLQLGTLITEVEMGGLNKHNWIIWQEKLSIWKSNVIEKIQRYKQNHIVDRVVIAALGDMVEGTGNIFAGQAWKLDANVVDQAINGANDSAAAFIEILLSHPDVHFDILEVFGNHGRLGNKGDYPYACSMDKVYQRMLQSQLQKVKDLKNYTYHENDAWFYFVEIYGWNHLLLHGDQGMSKLWSSRPTINGLEKGLTRYNQMFQEQIHFVHCGHFHSDVTMSFNLSQILINGSFVGTSSFSATQLVASSPPVQVMHVFEPRVGLYATERICLTTSNVKKSLKPHKLI